MTSFCRIMCSRVRIVSGNATETRPEMPQLSLPWRRRPRPVQTGCAGASERAGATRCAFRATLGAPRARSTLCILQSASGRPVRLPMRSACGWRRKSTGPARIRPGVTRSTEVSRASSLLHVARLNPRGPVEHDSSGKWVITDQGHWTGRFVRLFVWTTDYVGPLAEFVRLQPFRMG